MCYNFYFLLYSESIYPERKFFFRLDIKSIQKEINSSNLNFLIVKKLYQKLFVKINYNFYFLLYSESIYSKRKFFFRLDIKSI